MADSRDKDGHFCGQYNETGELAITPEGTVGYCGPNCDHCKGFEIYALQNGVWVCAADYDYEKDRHDW